MNKSSQKKCGGDFREKKLRFLSLASHELRTPLVSIKGYTDLILNRYDDEVSDRVEEFLRVVERNSERLIGLTDDLFKLERLEKGELEIYPEPLHIGVVLKEVLCEVKPLLESRGQPLEVGIPEELSCIKADRTHIEAALLGLMNSVSVLSLGEDPIFLDAVEKGESIVIRVSSDGPQLKKGEIENLFEPFPDIKDLYSRGGSGASLCLCKNLIELHGGEMWIEKGEKDKMTSFNISLPKQQRA